MSLLAPAHAAPFRIVAPQSHEDPLKDGDLYFVLRFPDGTERGSVAIFQYDPIGVRQQLQQLGYTVTWDHLRARRDPK